LSTVTGLWRSLVAHLTGGQGVASSNLASPTEPFRYMQGIRGIMEVSSGRYSGLEDNRDDNGTK
jgi:hypothetical protein